MAGRFYPIPCRSINCGEILCPEGCPHLPELQAFEAWRTTTGAIQPDPVWLPTLWAPPGGAR